MKQMVSFTENPENFDSSVMVKHIDEQLSDCMSLERTLSAIDKELAVDPRYVHRVRVCLFQCVVWCTRHLVIAFSCR